MRRSFHSRGFTMVELLVSIAIGLVLVLGINWIFQATSKTVGAGQSLLSAGRDARTFLQTMSVDLGAVDPVAGATSTVGDPVCFIIQSQHVYAFRNLADQKGASDPARPWFDTQLFAGAEFPGNMAPVPFVSSRSCRIDKLGFFARGLYARETSSNSTNFVSPTNSAEAWIVYGHASQPNKGVVTGVIQLELVHPGALDVSATVKNDYNFRACDWMLARMAIVLVPSPTATDPVYLVDAGGLTPLSSTSAGGNITGETSTTPINTARLDIAQTSIAKFGSSTRANGLASYGKTGANYAPGTTVWSDKMINYRIQASPFIVPTPGASATAPKLAPYGLAKCAPDLIRGCTQFIVEYAGNFYTKDNTRNDGTPSQYLNDGSGKLQTIPVPDATGTLDYFVDGNGNRHVRWYGFPRLVLMRNDPTNPAPLTNITVDATYGASGNDAVDAVVPLYDVLEKFHAGWGVNADAERFSTGLKSVLGSNYWTSLNPATDGANPGASPYVYTAAWGPDNVQPFPKMIRIVICIDDHEGRLNQPQFYEYIFDVQQ